VSIPYATAPTPGQVVACSTLIEHAIADVEDGERLLRAGDRRCASTRLLKAASLLKLAARELDSEIGL
jgi:hypothetical protein